MSEAERAEKRAISVAKGALLLIISNFIIKFIGIIYKIPLTNMIGGYGMGFFSSAYEIHQMLLSIATTGLPVALSKMISESRALGKTNEISRIFKVTLIAFSIVGLLGSAIMYFGAGAFSRLINSDLAVYSIMALAPSMFFLTVTSVLRGYFQGFQNMVPTATSQVIEALFKMIAGITIAFVMIKAALAPEYISAGAIFGTTFSTVVATGLMIFFFFQQRKKMQVSSLSQDSRTSWQIIKEVFKIIIPVTAGSLVVNLTGFLDLFLIMNRLGDIGVSQVQATLSYGAYKNCAQTLFNLPPSIIASINVSVIPALASAFVVGNFARSKKIMNTALKVVILFAVPCAIGLYVLAGPILSLLFPVRPEEVAIATPLLRILGVASLWVSIASLTTAALQAIGKLSTPVISLAIGGLIKLGANYFLVGSPEIGITGAPIGTNLCYFVIMIINLVALQRSANLRFRFVKIFLRPLLAGGIMGLFAYLAQPLIAHLAGGRLSTTITIILCVFVYLAALLLVQGVEYDDIASLPGGKRIARLLHLRPKAPKGKYLAD